MAKQTLIFGDSYSTFEGYIPQGYAIYYHAGHSDTDVTRVEETWWHQVSERAGLNLVQNNSWSGSTIGYTGYGNTDCSHSSSFIYRLRKLREEGFFARNPIDTVFVFGGTNDSWSDAPLGESMPEGQKEADLFSVLPAISYFLSDLKKTLPEADIYCLVNTELKPEITSELQSAALRAGICPIVFSRIDKLCGHPTIQGMKDIADRVLAEMK